MHSSKTQFNQIGARAAALAVRFTYHNRGYGLKPIDGVVPFELVADRTDPSVVDLQMDVYWTTAGGADPIAYLQRYKGRYKSLHVKDMAKPARFAGDGGDASQWIASFRTSRMPAAACSTSSAFCRPPSARAWSTSCSSGTRRPRRTRRCEGVNRYLSSLELK